MTATIGKRRAVTGAVAVLLLLTGTGIAGQGGIIYAKAWLAQRLLARAWVRTQAGATAARPWPWADTWVVARIVVPRLGVDQYVLSEASGRALAFGPGHLPETAAPGATDASVIAGHRDTHFAFLRDLQLGDVVRIERASGAQMSYRVNATTVVDANAAGLRTDVSEPALALVTCYPFDTPVPGGPLRYVVTAGPLPPAPDA